MARRKKKRGKQGAFSKVINIIGWVIGLARPIEVLINQGFSVAALQNIMKGLTFGLSGGGFNLQEGMRMYVPVGAAIGYRQFTKYLMRHFPVR